MQTISIRTTQNVTILYRLAGVGDRILAYLLDSVIIFFYSLLVWVLFFVGLVKYDLSISIMAIIGGIVAIPIVFYHLLFEIFMDCQTPGKRAMNIKIVKLDGSHPTIGNHFLRWLCRFVDMGPVGVILIAATEKAQRLGDLAADTTVVKVIDQREITAEDIFITPEENYTATFPQVVQLDARDIELIQKSLDASREFGNDQPINIVSEKIKALLGIHSQLPPFQFLATIVKDYNHLTSR